MGAKNVFLKNVKIRDEFWEKEMELIRTEVIPYQWEALHDRVEGAAPSYCIHNFEVAARRNRKIREEKGAYQPPVYTTTGFCVWPESLERVEERFYGFVFQDSDLYKWLEAVAYSLVWHPDERLTAMADEAIELICAAQQEDGYLDTFYIINDLDQRFTDLRDHHELYCFGHLAEAGVAYYRATGKDKLLKAACRFADCIMEHLGAEPGKKPGYPGHEIAEMALMELYEVTGEKKYLDLGAYFLNERGKRPYYFDREHEVPLGEKDAERYHYHQSHIPVREQREAVGHAVRGVYLYSGMADYARISGEEEMAEACRALFENIYTQKLYITGGIGGTHLGEAFSFPYDLPNDTAYAETCASIGLVFFARRMLQLEEKRQYADVMELALYNGVLAGMALDGKSFFYVNPLEVVPEACHKDERKFHVKPVRQKWFGCACCPPNLARMIGSIGSYVFTETDDTLFLNLYIGCEAVMRKAGSEATVVVESKFPWSGKVNVCVEGDGKAKWSVAFRIPQWSGWTQETAVEKVRRQLDREAQITARDGYVYVKKSWGKETICLDFPMKAMLVQANDRVRETEGQVAVKRGPVVYCLEEIDNGKDLHRIRILDHPEFQETWGMIQGNKIIEIEGKGAVRTALSTRELYQEYRSNGYEQKTLRWVPYYTWANRGEGEMRVFSRILEEK
ncbi:MAG: glycoside hydrolase family 127 protein [Lachnospiraceae bacterium]|nr:glycoside hydrolase family 127 protein [Robinsoniella sp.]MDY3765139.1 glycoside hydrolase family 127 protein [Lachnospiraceae bacterium]